MYFINKIPSRYRFAAGMILSIAVLLEAVVFNYKWLDSIFDKEIPAAFQIAGAEYQGDGIYTITDSCAVLEFHNIDQIVRYICFLPGDVKGNKAEISIAAKDEANENYIAGTNRVVLHDVKQSQYIRLHFSGKISDLKISINGMEGKELRTSDVRLGVHVPLMLSWVRLCIMVFVMLGAYILRRGSGIYKYKTDLRRKKQRWIVGVLLAAYSWMFWGMIHWNTPVLYWHENMEHHQQYYKLAEAFLEGRLYTDDDVPEELLNMENPYDRFAREEKNVSFKWDHAYFEGKYYCYFGAVPVLLLYIPYNFLMGGNLPNYIAVFILGILFMIGSALLIWRIIDNWFKKTPFVMYLIIHIVFIVVSGLSYAVYKPDFYIVPILSALVFTVFGLELWLSSWNKEYCKTGKLCSCRLLAGSFCIALTAGCRPQFLLAALLGIIFFWDDIFKKRLLFSKKSVRQTAAVGLPFLVVGAAIMWYNAARFGSVMDFGATYNLTSNDMTHRGFVFGRTGLGIFTYLFQPVNLFATFPFIKDFSVATVYQGLTLSENMMGGVYVLYPVLVTGLYGVYNKKLFSDNNGHKIVCLALFMSVAVVAVDTQMAGLLMRYDLDFLWMLMLASVFTIFSLYQKYERKEELRQKIIRLVIILSVVTLILAFLSVLAHDENPIKDGNPVLYYKVQHLIAFWI